MGASRIRVLVVDDHKVVREGLSALLNTEPGIDVVAEAEDGEQAVRAARIHQPDVAVMDLVMPQMDGIQAIRSIHQEEIDTRFLVLTSFGEEAKLNAAIDAGALGFLLKDTGAQELIQAIQNVHQGLSSLHPTAARQLIQQLRGPSDSASSSPRDTLTGREQEVLRALAQGYSNQDIASELGLSERTVRTHISNILRKLGLTNRTQAALLALREGLATLHEPTE